MVKAFIYLDTNIFLTSYLEREGFNKINDFFLASKNLEVDFVTSDWTLTEVVKVLVYEYKKKTLGEIPCCIQAASPTSVSSGYHCKKPKRN